MSTLVFSAYKYLLLPTAMLLVKILGPFSKGKFREILEDRRHQFLFLKKPGGVAALAEKRPIWIHAASGEIEYARPLIRELKKNYPQTPLIVTYTSPSAKKILENIPDLDAWMPLPWEKESLIRQFVRTWNPRCLFFSRTDVWPVLAHTLQKLSVPTVLFSATFADNSSRLRGLAKYLTKSALEDLNQIHCVSDQDLLQIKSLNLKTPVFVSGDTRFDQVFHRLENPRPVKSELMPSPDDFVFIAGSTWPEDEAVLIDAISHAPVAGLRCIMAPHETNSDHLDQLERRIKAAGLKSVRYSQVSQWPSGAVLVIDVVGVLAELYTWGDVAFIGGSFRRQVHSVMEALAAGLPVLVGPYHVNNREALHYQRKNFSSGMIVQVVQTATDISVLLERMKKQQLRMASIKEEIRGEIGKNKNSTLRVLESLKDFL